MQPRPQTVSNAHHWHILQGIKIKFIAEDFIISLLQRLGDAIRQGVVIQRIPIDRNGHVGGHHHRIGLLGQRQEQIGVELGGIRPKDGTADEVEDGLGRRCGTVGGGIVRERWEEHRRPTGAGGLPLPALIGVLFDKVLLKVGDVIPVPFPFLLSVSKSANVVVLISVFVIILRQSSPAVGNFLLAQWPRSTFPSSAVIVLLLIFITVQILVVKVIVIIIKQVVSNTPSPAAAFVVPYPGPT
mmetsp:Transcript_2522/g.7403  ORF Transcript_2522/g.7403 Transcript_2522/m.7403 type:complete len:242 (+) Transcript_2522:916-1641(+)